MIKKSPNFGRKIKQPLINQKAAGINQVFSGKSFASAA
jgi:hypothetical protein